jgi:hypothetical protein
MHSLSQYVDLLAGGMAILGFLFILKGRSKHEWSDGLKIAVLVAFALAFIVEGGFDFALPLFSPVVSGDGQVSSIQTIHESYPRGVERTYFSITFSSQGSLVGPLMGPFKGEDSSTSLLTPDDDVEFTYTTWNKTLQAVDVKSGPHLGISWKNTHAKPDNGDVLFMVIGTVLLLAATFVFVTGIVSRPSPPVAQV